MKLHIYIQLPGYMREWLTTTIGTPVVFPPHSVENAIIARNIGRLPHGEKPELYCDGDVIVEVPVIRYKPASEFNYLGRRGKVMLTDAIDDLFCIDMWNSLAPYLSSSGINGRLDDWCAERGITLDNIEAVRQRFYRLRKNYAQYHIILGKKYKKNLKKISDDGGKK